MKVCLTARSATIGRRIKEDGSKDSMEASQASAANAAGTADVTPSYR